MSIQDSLWDGVDDDNGGDRSEPLRSQGPRPLAQAHAGPPGADPGSGGVLHATGRGGSDGDRPDRGRASADETAWRRVPAGAGAAGNRAEDGRDASHPGDAPGRPGGSGENRSAAGLRVFTPDAHGDLAPSGVVARLNPNPAAITV